MNGNWFEIIINYLFVIMVIGRLNQLAIRDIPEDHNALREPKSRKTNTDSVMMTAFYLTNV